MKEVWEISLEEFRADIMQGTRDYKLLGHNDRYARHLVQNFKNAEACNNNADISQHIFNRDTLREHNAVVLIAEMDGKPVPVDILREYASDFLNPKEILDKARERIQALQGGS